MKKRYFMFMFLIVFTFVIGISGVKAVTISDTGAYVVYFEVPNGDIDGFNDKLVKFDFEEGEDSVTLSDLVGDSVVFSRGYTFEGWKESCDSETLVTSFTKEEIINNNISLGNSEQYTGVFACASFDPDEELPLYNYYLTLYSGIGRVSDVQYTNFSTEEDGFEFDLSEYTPVKEGYTFKGWYYSYYDEDAAVWRYVFKDNVITADDYLGDSNYIKLIAAWESNSLDMNKKRYVLNANGGKYINNETAATYNFEVDSSADDYVIANEIPTRDGYVFDGWYKSADGSGWNFKALSYGDYVPPCPMEETCDSYDSIDLYARWKSSADVNEDGQYAILFNAKGTEDFGSINGQQSYLVKFDILDGASSVNISDVLGNTPFNMGATFLGWKHNEDYVTNTSRETLENGSFSIGDNDYVGLVVNAAFSDTSSIDLSKYYLNLYSGIGFTNYDKIINIVNETDDFTIDLSEYTPVREGYTFKGWYQEKFNALDMETCYDKVTSLTADDFSEDNYNNIDLIAGWQSNDVDINKPMYTLNGNGGKINGVASKTYNYEVNNSYDVYLFAYNTPVREGYKFLGWTNGIDGDYIKYLDDLGESPNYDLYAKWQRLSYDGVPASISANLYGYDDVKISWDKVSDASYYKIYYKRSTSQYYTYLAQTTNLYKNAANLADGVKYYFKVVAVKQDGVNTIISSKYRYASVYTLKKLNTPVVGKYSKNYVKVRWNNIYGESGYEIARSRYKTKNFFIIKRVNYNYSSSVIKTTRGYTYYYKVRAYKTVDGKKIYGPWSYLKSYRLS